MGLAFYVSLLLFVVVIIAVLARPKKLNIAIPPIIGSILLLLTGIIKIRDVIFVWDVVWNATFTLVAIILLSIILDRIGFFSYLAVKIAKRLNRPVFLSIGYSTCHWCHVMERESFEDQEVAEAINKTFIPIKVDREERPDLDSFYMNVCQMLTGGGGWPLNLILSPDRKPIFAFTYLPKRSRRNMMGIIELCSSVQELWRDKQQ